MLNVQRRSDNVLSVHLGLHEAVVLKMLPERLRCLLEDPDFNDRVARRFFPSAYDDEGSEREYRRLLGDELVRHKLDCVDAFDKTLRTGTVYGTGPHRGVEVLIKPEEYELWLGFVNDFRLMLGTELDIRDEDWGDEFDPDHPCAEDLALLHLLTWLEEELLRASGFELPPVDPRDIRKEG